MRSDWADTLFTASPDPSYLPALYFTHHFLSLALSFDIRARTTKIRNNDTGMTIKELLVGGDNMPHLASIE
jgi:hypothetical protein